MANLSNINNVLRVSSDLRVGINTDAASYALEIGGTNSGIKLKNSNPTNGRVYSLLSDTSGNFQIYDDAAASGRLVISNLGDATFAGDVTVNGSLDVTSTTSDAVFLRSSQATTTNVYITNTNATANNTANLYFAPANNIAGSYIKSTAIEDFSTSANRTSDLRFAVRKDGTFNEALIIDSDGNVGINRSSPNGLLHQQSEAGSNSEYYIQTGDTTTNSTIYFGDSDASIQGGIDYDHNDDSMSFKVNNSPRMVIDSSGVVNIGTATGTQPSYFHSYLNVQNNASTSDNASITITSGSGGYAGLHFGDSDNGRIGQVAYNNSNNSLLFTANNSTRMTIDSFGNAIFTGRIGAETTLTPVWSVQTGTSAVTIPAARYLNFYSNEINYANFSRGFMCSISDDTATTQPKQIGLIMHNNSKVNNTFSPGIVFGSQANSSLYSDSTAMIAGRRTNQVGDANWSAGQLWFWTATEGAPVSGAADRGLPDGYPAMVINEYRRVMIGTNTPTTAGQPNINQAFQVATGYSNDGIVIHGNGSTDGMASGEFRKIGFRYDETDESYESEVRFVVANSAAHGGQLEFWTDNSSGTKTRAMTITKSQYVGIGTTAPLAKLHIEGSNNNDGNDYAQLYIKGTGSYPLDIAGIVLDSAGSNQSHIRFHNNGTPKVQIRYNEGGNAVDKLGVYSFTLSANIAEFNNATGAFVVKGDVTAYGSPSDKRLKENIKPIESALDKVSKLQGVTFDWKEKGITNLKEDVGFIAQDVQKVIPELVRENEDGMLSMRHQGIAPILLEAIKELKAEIEELKSNKCNCNK